jgi:2-C-methyl-D-erythritol 2,4-cyclodiphosphate synthase
VTVTLVGFGYDNHRLEEGRPMVLGGVNVPDADRGPVAHSDGDVLLHALCDALLGAVGLEDIGHHFPDTDPAFKNANSLDLLRRVLELLRNENAIPVNVDCTLVLERPKIAPLRGKMRASIAAAMGLPENRVSVKATTNEKLGAIGAGEGIAAFAVATVAVHTSSLD